MGNRVTFKGSPLNLLGRVPREGSRVPNFKVVSQDLKAVTLADFKGKVKIITTFLSLDTPVCDLQVKEFNHRATGFSSDVVVLGISMDLPFAQKRFCQMNEIRNAVVLSDYRFSSFGKKYGLLIKELNLLARAVLIVDKEDRLRYVQVVEEMTNPPDYGLVLRHLEEIIKDR